MIFHVNFLSELSDFWHAKGNYIKFRWMPVRKMILIALAIFGVILGGYYMLHYQPAIRALWEVNDFEKYVDWHESLELDKRKESVTKLSGRMKEIACLLEGSHDTAEVMTEISEGAEKSDIEFVTINPMKAKEKEGYQLTAITLTVRANYIDLVRFIRWLEKSKKFINIVGINIMDRGDETGKLQIMLTIEVYQKSKIATKETAEVEG